MRKTRSLEQNTNLSRQELLQVAEGVAREKGIDREEILTAMEQAIQKAANARYGQDNDIRVTIHRQTGEVSLWKHLQIVEEVSNSHLEISLKDAQERDPALQLGEELIERLPGIEFGRIAAQGARHVIFQRVRDAERARQYEEFKDRQGHLMSGVVKRVEFGNILLDLGRAEGIIRRDELIQREIFRFGDRVRAYISEVSAESRGPVVTLSRTHPQFLARLFEQEVPEIYDGTIEIKSVARDPGSRAKMAVYATDPSLDPVGACVGMRGARVQAVVTELKGEKVDIVLWSSNPATFVVNALAPAEVVKVVLDEENQKVDVVVPEDQLSLAIGRRGQNVRLACQLTGWSIDVLTESQESTRRSEDYALKTRSFIDALDVDELIAQLLVSEGFTSIEDIALSPLEDLTSIEGFDHEIAGEIYTRALHSLNQKTENYLTKARELGLDESVISLALLSPELLLKVAEQGIRTLDDLADLSSDELEDMVGVGTIGVERANEIIMAARAHWFHDDPISDSNPPRVPEC